MSRRSNIFIGLLMLALSGTFFFRQPDSWPRPVFFDEVIAYLMLGGLAAFHGIFRLLGYYDKLTVSLPRWYEKAMDIVLVAGAVVLTLFAGTMFARSWSELTADQFETLHLESYESRCYQLVYGFVDQFSIVDNSTGKAYRAFDSRVLGSCSELKNRVDRADALSAQVAYQKIYGLRIDGEKVIAPVETRGRRLLFVAVWGLTGAIVIFAALAPVMGEKIIDLFDLEEFLRFVEFEIVEILEERCFGIILSVLILIGYWGWYRLFW